MDWTLIITEHFKRAIEDRKDFWSRIDDAIRKLREDPFAEHLPVKALQSRKGVYRYRIGGFRLLFCIDQALHCVFLLTFAKRDDAYDVEEGQRKGGLIGAGESVGDHVQKPRAQPEDEPEEEGGLISEEELDLLGVPSEFIASISELEDAEALEEVEAPEWVRLRVLDWVTSSSPSDIAKLYCLAADDTAESIASRPLRGFLLSLDRQQRAVLTIAKHRGPVLVRGGPGTGKSLVGLYRLSEFVLSRQAESLLEESAHYGFITYTNTLVRANEKLFDSIRPKQGAPYSVRFDTLDAIAREIVTDAARRDGRQAPQMLPTNVRDAHLAAALVGTRAKASEEEWRWAERFSVEFVRDEVELVIEGRDIAALDEYLALERAGRGTPLMPQQRRVMWSIFNDFRALCRKSGHCSWGELRKLALTEVTAANSTFKKFDGLFIDEIQDLNVVGIRLCMALCKRVQFAMLAVDSGQSIYNLAPAWRGVHPELVFGGHNSLALTRNYRMTKQLVAALAPWRSEVGDGVRDQAGAGEAVFTGPPPVLISAAIDTHSNRAASIIDSLVKRSMNPNQIAVIVRALASVEARELRAELTRRSIPCRFFDKGTGVELDKPFVNIITAHSAKGLEFPMVVVPFVSDTTYPFEKALHSAEAGEKDNVLQQERRLLYVASSRASHMLWVIADAARPSRFLAELDRRHWT